MNDRPSPTRNFTSNWPYGWRTAKDSHTVVILKTDGKGDFPLIGFVEIRILCPMTGYELAPPEDIAAAWDVSGVNSGNSEFNLVNCLAPVVSVPVDKLMDGEITAVDCAVLGLSFSISIAPQSLNDLRRPVKWFFAEGVGTSK